jgi:RNA polymerase sigma factor (TIGR02999 family)
MPLLWSGHLPHRDRSAFDAKAAAPYARRVSDGDPGAKSPPAGTVTRLLEAWSRGEVEARDALIPVVYEELRRRAVAYLRRERPGHTLRPTALVHEAYLRLCAQNTGFKNREQFFGVASRLMRHILVDHARARAAAKRGGALRVTLAEGPAVEPPPVDLLDLDAALEELASYDERQGQLVELRFFGGLTLEEAARVLGVSLPTAKRDWAHAKAWLFGRLEPGPPAGSRS